MLYFFCFRFLNSNTVHWHCQFHFWSFGSLSFFYLLVEFQFSNTLFHNFNSLWLINFSGAQKLWKWEVIHSLGIQKYATQRLTLTRYAICPEVRFSGEWSQFLFFSSFDFFSFFSFPPTSLLILLFCVHFKRLESFIFPICLELRISYLSEKSKGWKMWQKILFFKVQGVQE